MDTTQKNNTDKISKLDDKIKQLQAQKNALLIREKDKERKARTKRLIDIGAIFNSFGIDTVEKANTLKEHFQTNEKSKTWLQNLISNHQPKDK